MPRAKNKPIPALTEADVARFRSRVDKTPGQGPTGECWPFKGPFTAQGYGRFGIGSRFEIRSNRLAYYLGTGIDPGDNEVLHSCDWEPCCRDEHLSAGSRLDNAREAVARGRYPTGDRNGSRKHPESLLRGDDHPARKFGVKTKGELNGFSKLTTEQVLEIRRRFDGGGICCNDLARELGMPKQTVYGIITRRAWKHV